MIRASSVDTDLTAATDVLKTLIDVYIDKTWEKRGRHISHM